jgi:hypothetical protein
MLYQPKTGGPGVIGENLDEVVRQILSGHRHLMTEAERRADRAFYYQEKLDAEAEAAAAAELTASLEQALDDPIARSLFKKGRARFLREMARRIVAEDAPQLPRCSACGAAFKKPHPKTCFDCDY